MTLWCHKVMGGILNSDSDHEQIVNVNGSYRFSVQKLDALVLMPMQAIHYSLVPRLVCGAQAWERG